MAQKYIPSPGPWRTTGSHKPNGEAVYLLSDVNQQPIGTIRSDGLPAEVTKANRKLIENAPKLARVCIDFIAICIKEEIPVRGTLCDLMHYTTGVNPRNFEGIIVDDGEVESVST